MSADGADRVGLREFSERAGDDWRVLGWGAHACFRTADAASAARLVSAVLVAAEELGADPHVDVRPGRVVVVVGTPGAGFREHDLALAGRASAAAAELGLAAEPGAVQEVQLAVDAGAAARVTPFWRAVLGYEPVGDEDLLDPLRRGPSLWFQELDHVGPRLHLDVFVPHDRAEQRVAAAVAAGGRLVADHAPTWWTLADEAGQLVDVTCWLGRE